MAEKKTTGMEEVKDYSSMKKVELLALAKEMGAKVNTKTRKADIIAAIEAIEKDTAEAVEPEVAETVEEVAEATEEVEAEVVEAAEETEPEGDEVVEEAKSEVAEAADEVEPDKKEETEEASEPEKEEPAEAEEKAEEASEEETEKMRASTERKRQMKAERREAKAARKEANKVEEKKKRPSNLLLAILIFGVLIGMFVFIKGYNYFTKPASIEKYMEDQGMAEMYTDMPYDEHSTITIRAKDNTIRMLIKLNDDVTDEQLKDYTDDDATKELKQMGAGFLTSLKPETQGFGGTVKVGVKKGDETVNYIKMSYSEAKKFMKDLEKEAEEEADDAEDAAEDAAEEGAEAAEEATED